MDLGGESALEPDDERFISSVGLSRDGHDPDTPGPGDIPPTPEGFHPVVRGGEPTSLVTQAMAKIDGLKRAFGDLMRRVESVEGRLGALESRLTA